MGAVLGSWLKLPVLAPAAVDLSGEMPIQALLCADPRIHEPAVFDGLGFSGQGGSQPGPATSDAHAERISGIEAGRENSCATGPTEIVSTQHAPVPVCGKREHQSSVPVERGQDSSVPHGSAGSDPFPGIKALDLSWINDTPVKHSEMIPAPPVKFRNLLKAVQKDLRSATLLDYLPPATDASGSFLPLNLPVRVGTPKFTRFPHSRISVDLAILGIQESERLTHEAETVRGIAHGQGELLALFLSVPVEIVSRVRFVEEPNQLMYTLSWRPGMMRTRVHDMLAVRDRGTGETHLVPHRTRYRMAFLA